MYSVRTTKTASGATAVQIVKYLHRKRIVVKHVGSAHTANQLASLKQLAGSWIETETRQLPLFAGQSRSVPPLIPLAKCQYLGFRYTFLYQIIHRVFRSFHLEKLDLLLLDLALIRVAQPASKLESLELLSELFGLDYHRTDFYRRLPIFVSLKPEIEDKLMAFAKDHLNFDLTIVFYDVTTLYFETFREDKDKFRQTGFSKDNKPNQPQIVIGLIVTGEGFPVSYQLFAGNVFEGHTFLPVILGFKQAHAIDKLTIVADAAMISLDNVNRLRDNRLFYIVGARVSGLPLVLIKDIAARLAQADSASCRLETNKGALICDFSLKRYQRDEREMKKQLAKAEQLLRENTGLKRTKFLKRIGKTSMALNPAAVKKAKLVLGIKGYYTNLTDVDDNTIINQYHSLWHVEQAFRIAKSDLAIRPVYHFKKYAIEAHILICFIALAVCRYLELKTNKSTKKILKLLKSVTDARLRNTLTNEEFSLRSEIPEELRLLLKILQH